MSDGTVTKRVGRPPALTPEVEKRFLDHVRVGVPLTRAARLAGITPTTYFRWMDRGAEEQARADNAPDGEYEPDPVEGPFREFRERALVAKDEAVARAIMHVQQAAQGGYVTERTTRRFRDGTVEETEKRTAPDWRAADRVLRYTAPEDFARVESRLEVTGEGGGPVRVEDARMVELAARLRREVTAGPDDVEDGEVVDGD